MTGVVLRKQQAGLSALGPAHRLAGPPRPVTFGCRLSGLRPGAGFIDEAIRVPEDIAVRVPAENMASTVTSIFEKLGLPREDAAQSTDVLIYADLRGIDSHGVSNMMPLYVEWLTTGRINATPQWKVIREARPRRPSTATLGWAWRSAHRSWTWRSLRPASAGSAPSLYATARTSAQPPITPRLLWITDMIGVAMTIGGMWVVPTFGAEAKLGLNPIAVAAPTRNEPAFIFDASMSSIAGNKIRIAERLGSEVLPGWIAMPDGTPVMGRASRSRRPTGYSRSAAREKSAATRATA